MSMKPGATKSPVASISGHSVAGTEPTAVIVPPSIATSPANGSPPLPSRIVPFRIVKIDRHARLPP